MLSTQPKRKREKGGQGGTKSRNPKGGVGSQHATRRSECVTTCGLLVAVLDSDLECSYIDLLFQGHLSHAVKSLDLAVCIPARFTMATALAHLPWIIN
eukprot:6167656-Amphidinium_carterae.6